MGKKKIELTEVLNLVRQKKISCRREAELLGITYREFLDLMGKYKIPVFDYEKGWLEKELSDE